METTTFIKPRFAISALPGTGELLVQVKASVTAGEKSVRTLQTPALKTLS